MARPDNKKPRTSRWKKVRIAVLLARATPSPRATPKRIQETQGKCPSREVTLAGNRAPLSGTFSGIEPGIA